MERTQLLRGKQHDLSVGGEQCEVKKLRRSREANLGIQLELVQFVCVAQRVPSRWLAAPTLQWWVQGKRRARAPMASMTPSLLMGTGMFMTSTRCPVIRLSTKLLKSWADISCV